MCRHAGASEFKAYQPLAVRLVAGRRKFPFAGSLRRNPREIAAGARVGQRVVYDIAGSVNRHAHPHFDASVDGCEGVAGDSWQFLVNHGIGGRSR